MRDSGTEGVGDLQNIIYLSCAFSFRLKSPEQHYSPLQMLTWIHILKNQCCIWSISKHNINPKDFNFTSLRELLFFYFLFSPLGNGEKDKQSRIRPYCFLAFSLTKKEDSNMWRESGRKSPLGFGLIPIGKSQMLASVLLTLMEYRTKNGSRKLNNENDTFIWQLYLSITDITWISLP